jgi:hypothetical protein
MNVERQAKNKNQETYAHQTVTRAGTAAEGTSHGSEANECFVRCQRNLQTGE